jgi:hypothetical protein
MVWWWSDCLLCLVTVCVPVPWLCVYFGGIWNATVYSIPDVRAHFTAMTVTITVSDHAKCVPFQVHLRVFYICKISRTKVSNNGVTKWRIVEKYNLKYSFRPLMILAVYIYHSFFSHSHNPRFLAWKCIHFFTPYNVPQVPTPVLASSSGQARAEMPHLLAGEIRWQCVCGVRCCNAVTVFAVAWLWRCSDSMHCVVCVVNDCIWHVTVFECVWSELCSGVLRLLTWKFPAFCDVSNTV